METAMDEQANYERARRRVQQLRGFYVHLVVYVLVNVFLVGLNLFATPNRLWFYWPLFGWGIGIAIHAAAVFGGGWLWGNAWEERKIREFMDKEKPT